MVRVATASIVAILLAAPAAHADPCEASLPSRGTSFSGVVSYVGDGDSLCVELRGPLGAGKTPERWVEVRVADFYAPELNAPGGREAKSQLERLVMGRRVSCIAQHRSYDRIVARCTLRGASLGDLMRRAGVREGGRGLVHRGVDARGEP